MTQDAVVSCLNANRANTLPLLACLRACDAIDQAAMPEPAIAARPYREVEAELAEQPAMHLSSQTPHVLVSMLVEAGGIKRVDAVDDVAGDAPDFESVNQPADYLLCTTDAGRAALAQFDPEHRFAQLLADEPDTYRSAYAQALDACGSEGASRMAIEEALAGNPALKQPKLIYPTYFISKLETIGGLSWDGAWRITSAGRRMRALLAIG